MGPWERKTLLREFTRLQRRDFSALLEEALAEAEARQVGFNLFLGRIDNYRAVVEANRKTNPLFMVALVVRQLQSLLADQPAVFFHVEGEIFGFLLPGQSRSEGERLGRNLVAQVAALPPVHLTTKRTFQPNIRLGVVNHTPVKQAKGDLHGLLAAADRALHEAQRDRQDDPCPDR